MIMYSPPYEDAHYQYRHVFLPQCWKELAPQINVKRLLSEEEWRAIGITMSKGWTVTIFFYQTEKTTFFKKKPVEN